MKAASGRVAHYVADRFYPSSKTCSACGAVNRALALDERSWTCPACGERHQRDHNAVWFKSTAQEKGADR